MKVDDHDTLLAEIRRSRSESIGMSREPVECDTNFSYLAAFKEHKESGVLPDIYANKKEVPTYLTDTSKLKFSIDNANLLEKEANKTIKKIDVKNTISLLELDLKLKKHKKKKNLDNNLLITSNSSPPTNSSPTSSSLALLSSPSTSTSLITSSKFPDSREIYQRNPELTEELYNDALSSFGIDLADNFLNELDQFDSPLKIPFSADQHLVLGELKTKPLFSSPTRLQNAEKLSSFLKIDMPVRISKRQENLINNQPLLIENKKINSDELLLLKNSNEETLLLTNTDENKEVKDSNQLTIPTKYVDSLSLTTSSSYYTPYNPINKEVLDMIDPSKPQEEFVPVEPTNTLLYVSELCNLETPRDYDYKKKLFPYLYEAAERKLKEDEEEKLRKLKEKEEEILKIEAEKKLKEEEKKNENFTSLRFKRFGISNTNNNNEAKFSEETIKTDEAIKKNSLEEKDERKKEDAKEREDEKIKNTLSSPLPLHHYAASLSPQSCRYLQSIITSPNLNVRYDAIETKNIYKKVEDNENKDENIQKNNLKTKNYKALLPRRPYYSTPVQNFVPPTYHESGQKQVEEKKSIDRLDRINVGLLPIPHPNKEENVNFEYRLSTNSYVQKDFLPKIFRYIPQKYDNNVNLGFSIKTKPAKVDYSIFQDNEEEKNDNEGEKEEDSTILRLTNSINLESNGKNESNNIINNNNDNNNNSINNNNTNNGNGNSNSNNNKVLSPILINSRKSNSSVGKKWINNSEPLIFLPKEHELISKENFEKVQKEWSDKELSSIRSKKYIPILAPRNKLTSLTSSPEKSEKLPVLLINNKEFYNTDEQHFENVKKESTQVIVLKEENDTKFKEPLSYHISLDPLNITKSTKPKVVYSTGAMRAKSLEHLYNKIQPIPIKVAQNLPKNKNHEIPPEIDEIVAIKRKKASSVNLVKSLNSKYSFVGDNLSLPPTKLKADSTDVSTDIFDDILDGIDHLVVDSDEEQIFQIQNDEDYDQQQEKDQYEENENQQYEDYEDNEGYGQQQYEGYDDYDQQQNEGYDQQQYEGYENYDQQQNEGYDQQQYEGYENYNQQQYEGYDQQQYEGYEGCDQQQYEGYEGYGQQQYEGYENYNQQQYEGYDQQQYEGYEGYDQQQYESYEGYDQQQY